MELQFNYKGSKYILFFYPCGNRASVTKNGGMTREIKYDSKLTVKKFLHGLENIRFN